MVRSYGLDLLVACFSCSVAQADDSVDQLVVLTLVREQLVQLKHACQKDVERDNLEELYSENPGMFYGVEPSDDNWPLVSNAYVKHAKEACVPSNIDDYLDFASKLYKDELLEEDVAAAVKFYGTDSGRRFMEASNAISAMITDTMREEHRELGEVAARRFDQSMLLILGAESK